MLCYAIDHMHMHVMWLCHLKFLEDVCLKNFISIIYYHLSIYCIGMVESKEFAMGIFDALARRRRQKIGKITKEELYEFWLQITDHSFDARLQIFFDMWVPLSLSSQFVCNNRMGSNY